MVIITKICAACDTIGTSENPVFEYVDGSFLHDDCATELQIPESDMVTPHAVKFASDANVDSGPLYDVDCGPFGVVSAPIVVVYDENGNVVSDSRETP